MCCLVIIRVDSNLRYVRDLVSEYESFLVEDLESQMAVFKLRYSINIQELGWTISSDHGKCWVSDQLDECSSIFATRSRGEIIASLRTTSITHLDDAYLSMLFADRLPSDCVAQHVVLCSRLGVSKDYRGTPSAMNLLSYTLAHENKNGRYVSIIYCSPKLVGFYQRLGWVIYSYPLAIRGLGIQILMALDSLDDTHLRRVRSPLSGIKHYDNRESSTPYKKWFSELVGGSPKLSRITVSELRKKYPSLSLEVASVGAPTRHVLLCEYPKNAKIWNQGDPQQPPIFVASGAVSRFDGQREVSQQHHRYLAKEVSKSGKMKYDLVTTTNTTIAIL